MRNKTLDTSRSTLWKNIDEQLGRFETQCLAGGAIIGWVFGWFYKGHLLIAPAHLSTVIDGFGGGFIANLHLISAVFGAFTLFVIGRIITSWIHHNAPTEEEIAEDRKNRLFLYKLPPWPKTEKLSFIIGEYHGDNASYIPNPEWATIPLDGLFGNIFVCGSIGSGKTASCAYPFVEQVLNYHPNDAQLKPCGLVLDEKGDFFKTVEAFAKKVNRENDIIRIEIGGEHTWNPIHAPEIMVEVLAGRLVALYENMVGGSGGSGDQWVKDGMFKIIKHGLGIHRIAYGYVTVKDLNDMVADMSGGDENEDDNPVLETLSRYDAAIAHRRSKGELSDDEESDYSYHRRFFEKELACENPKNKATYVSAVTSITDLFSKPSVAKTFCPPKDKIKLINFESIIESGKIIALNAPPSQYGSIGTAIGVMLKLEFQRTLLGRVSREAKNAQLNKDRMAFFICDEYQNFVTTSGKNTNEGDDKFYAESRQSKCVSMVLTQSITTLVSKTGKEKAQVILGSLRSMIFLAVEPENDRKAAAELCGKSLQQVKSQSFSESLKDSGYNPLSRDVSGSSGSVSSNVSFQERHDYNVQPTEFGTLQSFESISLIFNGIHTEVPKRVYHKTNFIPDKFVGKFTKRTIPYKLLIDELKRKLSEKEQ